MGLKIVLEFSDEDLQYFSQVMDDVSRRNANSAEKDLVEGARRLLQQAREQNAPEYVQNRLGDLGVLIAMLDDAEWPLEDQDRRRIVAAVGYFAVPNDLIPDTIPGLGFLDDALMAELVIRELKPELDGYRDFSKYRDNEAKLRGRKVSRADWLAAKRRQVWLRIRRRQEESRMRHASNESPTLPILRYNW